MMEKAWKKEDATDVANVMLGVFLFLTPWIFGFASETAAAWTAWIGGIVIAGLAIAAIAAFAEWEEWLNLLAGLVLAMSPWLIGFSANSVAMQTHLILGLVVAAIAALRLWLFYSSPPQVTA